MDLIAVLIINIIPLYILIALGFVAGKWFDVNLPSMATVAIYILAPIVNFGAMAQMEFTPEYILLPIIFFIISTFIGTTAYLTAQKIWQNNTANLIGMGSVTGNTMYFGLPIIIALLGPEWVGVYALLGLGSFLNEVGLGYFFGARGNATIKGALLKVIKLPVIHAIWLGLLYNLSDLPLPEAFNLYWNYAIGAWVILGMMIIGIAISKQSKLEIDIKLIVGLYASKFILWPIFGFAVIIIDKLYFQTFSTPIYQMIAVFSTTPLAGNLVAYAATLKLHPERMASAVLISTILGIFTVPLAVLALKLLS